MFQNARGRRIEGRRTRAGKVCLDMAALRRPVRRHRPIWPGACPFRHSLRALPALSAPRQHAESPAPPLRKRARALRGATVGRMRPNAAGGCARRPDLARCARAPRSISSTRTSCPLRLAGHRANIRPKWEGPRFPRRSPRRLAAFEALSFSRYGVSLSRPRPSRSFHLGWSPAPAGPSPSM